MYRKLIATSLGHLELFCSDVGLMGVYFEKHRVPRLGGLGRAQTVADHAIFFQFETELTRYLEGNLTSFQTPIDLSLGTPFQRKVWQSLLSIRYGRVISYADQARDLLKAPQSFRAVAAANGRNPLSIIIPCHRVIAGNGSLQGYAGGLLIKQRLLELEGHYVSNEKVQQRGLVI